MLQSQSELARKFDLPDPAVMLQQARARNARPAVEVEEMGDRVDVEELSDLSDP